MWKIRKNNRQIAFNAERVLRAAQAPLDTVFAYFQTTSLGLTNEEVEKRQSLYGKNEIVHEKKKQPVVMVPIVLLVNGITKGTFLSRRDPTQRQAASGGAMANKSYSI